MIKLIPIKTITDIKQGDTLLISGNFNEGPPIQTHTAVIVKVTETDGTEIILHKRSNLYFNLGMYLDGKSWWVKDVQKVVTDERTPSMGVNFDGFRRQTVNAYNDLVEKLNRHTDYGTVEVESVEIQEALDDLRDKMGTLICLEREGEFESLSLDLAIFNPDGEEDY